MTEESDSTIKTITLGINEAIRKSSKNLETITKNLDYNFNGLDANKLPEYQKALDALNTYEKALIQHFTEKYNS